jgi:hypothetical protein
VWRGLQVGLLHPGLLGLDGDAPQSSPILTSPQLSLSVCPFTLCSQLKNEKP